MLWSVNIVHLEGSQPWHQAWRAAYYGIPELFMTREGILLRQANRFRLIENPAVDAKTLSTLTITALAHFIKRT